MFKEKPNVKVKIEEEGSGINFSIVGDIENYFIDIIAKMEREEDMCSDVEQIMGEYFKNFSIDVNNKRTSTAILRSALEIYKIIVKIHPPFNDKRIKLISKKSIEAAIRIWAEQKKKDGKWKTSEKAKVVIDENNKKILTEMISAEIVEKFNSKTMSEQRGLCFDYEELIKDAIVKTNIVSVALYLGLDAHDFELLIKRSFPDFSKEEHIGSVDFTDKLIDEIVVYLKQDWLVADVINYYKKQNIKIALHKFWKAIAGRHPEITKEWYRKVQENKKEILLEQTRQMLGQEAINALSDSSIPKGDLRSVMDIYGEKLKETALKFGIAAIAEILFDGQVSGITTFFKARYNDWYINEYVPRNKE